jgi:RNA polymerase sigma factor (sigma-70 family)
VSDQKNTDENWLERIALKEAIDRLSEREQHILSLRFFDGKTQMEVASEIGISHNKMLFEFARCLDAYKGTYHFKYEVDAVI